jgi:hypothetical protein
MPNEIDHIKVQQGKQKLTGDNKPDKPLATKIASGLQVLSDHGLNIKEAISVYQGNGADC